MKTKTTLMITRLGALLAIGGLATPAFADETLHIELTTGFRVTGHDFSDVPFALESGGGELGELGIAALAGDDVDGVEALGARVGVRLGLHPLRVGFGFDLPGHANVARRSSPAGGDGSHTLRIERVSHWGFEVALGGEIPFDGYGDPGGVYLDLVGSYHDIDAQLLIDGQRAVYTADTFDALLRGGVRIPVRDWLFVHVAAEVGLVGDTVWGAELGLGVGAF
jgi:hypothetical protein